MQTERAQSEVVGMILLVAIVVVAVSSVGYVLFVSFDDPGEPATEVNATANVSALELTHTAGEPIPVDELRVVVRTDTEEGRAPFTDGSIGSGDFAVGDRWTADWTTLGIDPTPDEQVDVVLVHDPSNSVVYRGTVVAG